MCEIYCGEGMLPLLGLFIVQASPSREPTRFQGLSFWLYTELFIVQRK